MNCCIYALESAGIHPFDLSILKSPDIQSIRLVFIHMLLKSVKSSINYPSTSKYNLHLQLLFLKLQYSKIHLSESLLRVFSPEQGTNVDSDISSRLSHYFSRVYFRYACSLYSFEVRTAPENLTI